MTELDRLIDLSVNLDDENLLSFSQEGEDHVFSDTYNARMQLLFCQSKPKARKRTAPWRHAVASILIVFTLAGAATAGAFWKEIVVFFETIYSQYANFNLTPSSSPSVSIIDDTLNSWTGYWFPGYMVEHFEFSNAVERGDTKQIIFVTDQQRFIQFNQMLGTATLGSDIEGTQIPGILVGDFNTFAFEKNVGSATLYTLVWSDGTTSFQLFGQVSLEELVNIAEHVVYVENTLEG